MAIIITICLAIVTMTLIISISCVKYYSSESKRALVNANERYNNLDTLSRQKDNLTCSLTEVIKSISEKNQNYSVNAKINQ